MYGHTPSSIEAGSIASVPWTRGRNSSAWREVSSELVGERRESETLNIQAGASGGARARPPREHRRRALKLVCLGPIAPQLERASPLRVDVRCSGDHKQRCARGASLRRRGSPLPPPAP